MSDSPSSTPNSSGGLASCIGCLLLFVLLLLALFLAGVVLRWFGVDTSAEEIQGAAVAIGILVVLLGLGVAFAGRAPSTSGGADTRPIVTWAESEELVAEWVRRMGWPRANRTAATGDGGIDVLGRSSALGAVAVQVKFEKTKTGRPALQQLYGAAHGVRAEHWLFFSYAGYSPMAMEYGNQMNIGLFTFDEKGSVRPLNKEARGHMNRVRGTR